MTDQSIQKLHRVSALVDGQLTDDEFAQTVADLESSAQLRSDWDTYHLVGDVMRGGRQQISVHDSEFVSRLMQKIAASAITTVAVTSENTRANGNNILHEQSANDSSWRLVVGLASVVMVGVVAWQAMSLTGAPSPVVGQQLVQQGTPGTGATLASLSQHTGESSDTGRRALVRRDGTSALALASEEPQVMIRDPHLDALLAAHRQFGSASALQLPSGFLRNATFDEGGR